VLNEGDKLLCKKKVREIETNPPDPQIVHDRAKEGYSDISKT
jgi:hypothetical protein